ncbi:MAG: flagellin [Candidatus Zixiibacteriota bacterium]
MSLRINHNIAALNGNRNLQSTTDSLSKSMQKLSSGFRINAASDDPAGLVISEQFRAQIAGLNRAIQNSEGSVSMVQTAEGALTEINNLLTGMRELAIHAANEGFNDADQLAADQAEIANAIKTIDRIAANTQFGTKKLLDGTKDNIATITSANTSGLTVKQSNLTTGAHSVSATKTADATSTLNTTSLGLSLYQTTGNPTNLAEKIHTIDVVQASDVAKKTSGAVTLADAFGNNLTVAAAATQAKVATTATVNALLATHAGNYTVTLNYQENGESVTGNQTLVIAVASGDSKATIASALQSQINLNSSLAGKVVASASAGNILVKAANNGAQYSLKMVDSTTTATTAAFDFTTGASNRGASANTINFTVNTAKNVSTTAAVTISAGTYTSLAGLVTAINGGATTGLTAAFGTVKNGAPSDIIATVANSNHIQFATQDEGSAYSIQLNNAGSPATGDLMNVLHLSADTLATTGTDALVSFDNYTNTITSVNYGSTRTVTLKNKADGVSGQGTVQMTVDTAANGVKLGNLLLDAKAAKFDVRLDGGPATSVSAGVNATVFNGDRSQSLLVNYALTSQGGTETINNTDESLVFQIGANVGQTVAIGIRNMSSASLGKNLPGNMYTSLSKIDVTTVQGAQDAQAIIDYAINEVSTTRGTLGSFQKNTLESNLRNLQIASQNLTSAESQIRDTDMAVEMSEFTKNQILVQAGTAMLAQANQMPQVVLSLFK